MTLTEQLKTVVEILKKEKVTYSLAGGLVASLYREEERLTKDLDFLILAENSSFALANKILAQLKLTPVRITRAELEGGPMHAIKSKNTPVWMVCGTSKDLQQIRVDFLLPEFPWFQKATVKDIHDVKLLNSHHLFWKNLDIDLELESLQNLEKYPLKFVA